MIGYLIGRQTRRLGDLLSGFVQGGGCVVVGNDKRTSSREHGKGRRRLYRKLIEREMIGSKRQRLLQFTSPLLQLPMMGFKLVRAVPV